MGFVPSGSENAARPPGRRMRASSFAPAIGSRWCRTAFPKAMSKLASSKGRYSPGATANVIRSSTPTMAARLRATAMLPSDRSNADTWAPLAREEHGQFAKPTAVLDDLLAVQVTEELGDTNEQCVAPGERGEVLALLGRDDRLGQYHRRAHPTWRARWRSAPRSPSSVLLQRRCSPSDCSCLDHQPWAATGGPSISGAANASRFGVDSHRFRVGDRGFRTVRGGC